MEVKENYKTVKISMKCDKCKIGYMERYGNTVLASDPPKYAHKCNYCGHIENYNVEYPHLGVEKIEDDVEEIWGKNYTNEDDWEPDTNDTIKAIVRCLFECVEDLKDLGYSYDDFY